MTATVPPPITHPSSDDDRARRQTWRRLVVLAMAALVVLATLAGIALVRALGEPPGYRLEVREPGDNPSWMTDQNAGASLSSG